VSITSQIDYDSAYPTVPLERWRSNVVEAAQMLGDEQGQSHSWLREDRYAWENPDELLCVVFDDALFERYLTDCAFSLSVAQREAGADLLSKLNSLNESTPRKLDPKRTLQDQRWAEIRVAALRFVEAMRIAS